MNEYFADLFPAGSKSALDRAIALSRVEPNIPLMIFDEHTDDTPAVIVFNGKVYPLDDEMSISETL